MAKSKLFAVVHTGTQALSIVRCARDQQAISAVGGDGFEAIALSPAEVVSLMSEGTAKHPDSVSGDDKSAKAFKVAAKTSPDSFALILAKTPADAIARLRKSSFQVHGPLDAEALITLLKLEVIDVDTSSAGTGASTNPAGSAAQAPMISAEDTGSQEPANQAGNDGQATLDGASAAAA